MAGPIECLSSSFLSAVSFLRLSETGASLPPSAFRRSVFCSSRMRRIRNSSAGLFSSSPTKTCCPCTVVETNTEAHRRRRRAGGQPGMRGYRRGRRRRTKTFPLFFSFIIYVSPSTRLETPFYRFGYVNSRGTRSVFARALCDALSCLNWPRLLFDRRDRGLKRGEPRFSVDAAWKRRGGMAAQRRDVTSRGISNPSGKMESQVFSTYNIIPSDTDVTRSLNCRFERFSIFFFPPFFFLFFFVKESLLLTVFSFASFYF